LVFWGLDLHFSFTSTIRLVVIGWWRWFRSVKSACLVSGTEYGQTERAREDNKKRKKNHRGFLGEWILLDLGSASMARGASHIGWDGVIFGKPLFWRDVGSGRWLGMVDWERVKRWEMVM
jgi:hypothetical protein